MEKVQVGRPDLNIYRSNLLLKAGPISNLDQVAQGLIHSSPEYLQGWQFPNLSE